MKFSLIMLLLFFMHSCGQQKDSYSPLKQKAIPISAETFELNKNELRTGFKLKGSKILQYSIDTLDEDTSLLSQYKNKVWTVTDTIVHSSYLDLVPSFSVEDLNRDGNQDLICWVNTNVNGNRWVLIYLNNPNTESLQKLQNTAEETDVWDDPEYNQKDKLIHCTRVSGSYGYSFESTYEIKDGIAIPIQKKAINNTHLDNNGEGGIEQDFIGEKGKWKQIE